MGTSGRESRGRRWRGTAGHWHRAGSSIPERRARLLRLAGVDEVAGREDQGPRERECELCQWWGKARVVLRFFIAAQEGEWKDVPQGLKPSQLFWALSARLKSCPDSLRQLGCALRHDSSRALTHYDNSAGSSARLKSCPDSFDNSAGSSAQLKSGPCITTGWLSGTI